MVSAFTFPPAGFGPGSQPDPEGDLQYMPMPSGMRVYTPHIPDAANAAALVEAVALLSQISEACKAVARGGAPVTFDLDGLPPATRRVIADALGQGEVSMKLRGKPAVMVQESVFAGVWLLFGEGLDLAEVAPVPSLVLARAHVPHRPATGVLARRIPGLANAPAILAELVDKSQTRCAGAMAHVVNLSLLPHTPQDLDWLSQALGEGAVTVLSRGYGNCRVTACAQAHVWKVQFYNSMDTLILDTYEVCEVPEVAIAAVEDLDDSAIRIRDVIGAIQ